MVEEYEYYDHQFDDALVDMLDRARQAGESSRRIVSKELHDSVVTTRSVRMRMACDAMWRMWKKQGSYESRIVFSPAKGWGAKLEIVFEV